MRILSGILFITMLLVIAPLSNEAISQTTRSSIVIHDTTSKNDGGENATQNLRNEIESALEKGKPCVETMDDQDLRDAIQDERERELLEGGDSAESLKNIGNKMGSGYVMSVSATPGPNGSTVYTVFVMDTQTAKTVARETGTDGKQIADKLMRQLGPYLADNCKPHWTGTIEYIYSFNETKQINDKGAMRASSRNTKRVLTQSSKLENTIKATLLPPSSKDVNSTTARVRQRTITIFSKKSSTSGELLCREPGRNPYYKGFSEEYSETVSQLGQGTDTMPVFISVDDDGTYSISVNAPGGLIFGKIETSRSATGCGSENPPPTNDAQSLPDGKLQATSFEATGKTSPSNRDVLAGTKNLPELHTKITWKLRLVKPKGKS